MSLILLTGAGFSQNWGGWLASEVFEYLLGCPELDDGMKFRLWQTKNYRNGNYEDTLAEMQVGAATDGRLAPQVEKLRSALVGMFNAMGNAYASVPFEPAGAVPERQVRTLLNKFDAIFTLNQDTLLERHYLSPGDMQETPVRRFDEGYLPGLKPVGSPTGNPGFDKLQMLQPDGTVPDINIAARARQQPYYKLHGSMTFVGDSGRIFIAGGNKPAEINRYPLLRRYHEIFAHHVFGARLMVIGYSFNDGHINRVIMDAAKKGGLRLFIVDPQGVDVLDKNRGAAIHTVHELMETIGPSIAGASRRSLLRTLGSDAVEFEKIWRFIQHA